MILGDKKAILLSIESKICYTLSWNKTTHSHLFFDCVNRKVLSLLTNRLALSKIARTFRLFIHVLGETLRWFKVAFITRRWILKIAKTLPNCFETTQDISMLATAALVVAKVRLHWTRSNLNLISTVCEGFQPDANFASGCLTSLRQSCFKWEAYFEKVTLATTRKNYQTSLCVHCKRIFSFVH